MDDTLPLLVFGSIGFIVGFLLSVIIAVSNSQCDEVMQCLDIGVEREACDKLFPRCPTTVKE